MVKHAFWGKGTTHICVSAYTKFNICGVHEVHMCVHMNDHKYLQLCGCIMCVCVCVCVCVFERESLHGQVIF